MPERTHPWLAENLSTGSKEFSDISRGVPAGARDVLESEPASPAVWSANLTLGFLPPYPSSARNRPRTLGSRLDSSGYRVKSELADASCIDPWYAFVTRTRTNQKISIIRGSMVRIKYNVVLNRAGDRCCPSPTAESNLNGRFEGPRKKDPAAMNRPKHMRQRWRAMRFVPRTPPRTSMRTSPAPASSITEPMKKVIPTGTPSCELAPLRTTLRPFIQVTVPSAKGIRSTTQSKPLVSPSLRLAVSHAVPIR